MNNFADGKFANTTDSFWPKKSYNKIINLNLLNSAKFLENIMNKKDEKVQEDSSNANPNKELHNYIDKSLKFYNKNFEDLLKESMLNKFDSVTYKTIKRPKRSANNLEKFLINYDQNN